MSAILEHPPVADAPAAESQATPNDGHRLGLVRHLTAAMMMGQVHGLGSDVGQIFDVLAKMLGDGRQLRISLALASVIGGDAGPARTLLAEGMDDWPEPQLARLSVAFALKLGGDPQWEDIVAHALATSADETTRRFARQVLES